MPVLQTKHLFDLKQGQSMPAMSLGNGYMSRGSSYGTISWSLEDR